MSERSARRDEGERRACAISHARCCESRTARRHPHRPEDDDCRGWKYPTPRPLRTHELGVVEVVVRRRVHLVPLDLLAGGVEAYRVRYGDPRRFFFENQLRLLVELRPI